MSDPHSLPDDVALPLKGMRVLDLSRVLAGPFATQFLADLGADVVKVEHPERGDDTRQWGPPFVQDDDGNRGNSAYYYCANRNKSFKHADFKTTEGQQLVRDLAMQADVLVENYKVDGLKAYGLDYDTLSQVHPSLIYCSITGFGQTGPYRYQPGYDFIIQAMSGLMSITGTSDGPPLRTGVASADLSASLHAVSAIVAALYARTASGRGCHIDISLLDTQVSMLSHHASNFLNGGQVPARIGNTHPNIVPYQVFSTQDKPIVIAVGNDHQYSALCDALDCPDLLTDERFRHNRERVEHREELVGKLQTRLTEAGSGHWLDKLNNAGVPAGPINNLEQVFDDPQIVAREVVCQFDTPGTSNVRGVRNPIVFTRRSD